MNGEDIPLNRKVGLKMWRISHELRELPGGKTNFYDDKIDDILTHLQAARAGLVEIAHGIQRERGS